MTLLDRLLTWTYHVVNRNDTDAIQVAAEGIHEYIAGLETRIAALEVHNGLAPKSEPAAEAGVPAEPNS